MLIPTEQFFINPAPIKPKIDLDSLIETSLPSLPGSLMRIRNMLRDYNTSTRAISNAISYEPNLVIRLLRMANSSLYCLEKNVTTIPVAIDVIGTKILHDIVMLEITSSAFSKEINRSIAARKVWEHSLVVALFARELGETLRMHGTEEAFTCGLLHDIGKIILLTRDEEEYSPILEISGEYDMLSSESKIYGYNHTEVGSLITRRWGLPEEVSYTILYHHNPSQSDQPMMVAHIVDVADIMANIKGFGIRVEDPEKISFSESVIKLRLSEEILESCWEKIQPNIEQLFKNFT